MPMRSSKKLDMETVHFFNCEFGEIGLHFLYYMQVKKLNRHSNFKNLVLQLLAHSYFCLKDIFLVLFVFCKRARREWIFCYNLFHAHLS